MSCQVPLPYTSKYDTCVRRKVPHLSVVSYSGEWTPGWHQYLGVTCMFSKYPWLNLLCVVFLLCTYLCWRHDTLHPRFHQSTALPLNNVGHDGWWTRDEISRALFELPSLSKSCPWPWQDNILEPRLTTRFGHKNNVAIPRDLNFFQFDHQLTSVAITANVLHYMWHAREISVLIGFVLALRIAASPAHSQWRRWSSDNTYRWLVGVYWYECVQRWHTSVLLGEGLGVFGENPG